MARNKQKVLEDLREAVAAIAEGVMVLRTSGINERALTLLIQQAAPQVTGTRTTRRVRIEDIKATLAGMEALQAFVFGDGDETC